MEQHHRGFHVTRSMPDDSMPFTHMLGDGSAAPLRPYITAETTLAAGEPGGNGEPFYAGHWQYPRDSLNLSIRTPSTRYIFRSHDEDELYDHTTDPHEQHNRAGDPAYQTLRQSLRDTLAAEIGNNFRGIARSLRSNASA